MSSMKERISGSNNGKELSSKWTENYKCRNFISDLKKIKAKSSGEIKKFFFLIDAMSHQIGSNIKT